MTMRRHLYADPNVVCIWQRDSALDPVDPTPEQLSAAIRSDPVIADPSADLSRVYYHSGLAYLGINEVWEGTFTTLGTSAYGWHGRTTNLFAHGQPGRPLISGNIIFGSKDVGFNGTILLQSRRSPANETSNHYVTLFTDDTYVKIREEMYIYNSYTALYATEVTIKVGIFNLVVPSDF